MSHIRPYCIYDTNAEQEKHSKCLQCVSFDFLLEAEQVVYDEGQFHLSRLLLMIRAKIERVRDREREALVRRDPGDDLR